MSRRRPEYKPPAVKTQPAKHPKGWDSTPTVTAPTLAYSALTDPSLSHFYGQKQKRRFLQESGIVAPDGRIVHMNKAYSRVVVAEQVFRHAEDDDVRRNEEEYQLRMRLRARTNHSRDKMLNDNRVNRNRTVERSALTHRKERRQELEKKCFESKNRLPDVSTPRIRKQTKPRIDWETMKYIMPDEQLVTTTVAAEQSPKSDGSRSSVTSDDSYSDDSFDSDGSHDSPRSNNDDKSASSHHSHTSSKASSRRSSTSRASTPARDAPAQEEKPEAGSRPASSHSSRSSRPQSARSSNSGRSTPSATPEPRDGTPHSPASGSDRASSRASSKSSQ